jgi:hypothetical protein
MRLSRFILSHISPIFATLLSLILMIFVTSCSAPRRAQYHYKRALANGLKVEQGSDTIRIATIDSIPVIKNDTIVWEKFIAYRDTVIQYNTVTLPKTRWQTRIEWKYRTKIEKIKGDVITKQHEVVKYKLRWWPFWLGLAIPFVLRLAWSALLSKLNR